jgi:DNA-binding CsgD family transcriptional regulator
MLLSATECFAGDLPEQEQRLVWATHTPPAADLFSRNAPGTAWRSKPSWYIVAGNDRTVQAEPQRFVAKGMGAATYEVHSSHLPMLFQPGLVIDVIRTAADAVQGNRGSLEHERAMEIGQALAFRAWESRIDLMRTLRLPGEDGGPLYGRDPELGVLSNLVGRASEGGGAVVVRGEAGIGKSSLVAESGTHAAARGMRTLAISGAQSEAHLPFAGLHQLLQPLLGQLDGLPSPHRAALEAAFGLSDTVAPDLFLIALATLDLLVEAAQPAPLLLIADDAHWLDRPTCDVLAFVARRVHFEPVVLVLAVREGIDNPFEAAGLPELLIGPLDDASAGALLDAHAPGLSPAVRDPLLQAAAGNPLALVELPVALGPERLAGQGLQAERMPLTARLERAFAVRVRDLPPQTRKLLLVAAANDSGSLAEVLHAGTLAGREPAVLGDLGPAVSARLVEVGNATITFRHPLVRSGIYQQADSVERQAVHAALSEVLASEPDRSVWHQAAAAIGPDEQVAVRLEEAAGRAHRRGAVMTAVAALERSAALSGEPSARGERLIHAAQLAFELGRRDIVLRLVGQADPITQAPLSRARMAWIRESFTDGIPGTGPGFLELIRAAEQTWQAGDRDLALNLLAGAALRCFWGRPGESARKAVIAAAGQMDVDDHDPRLVVSLAWASPFAEGATAVARLPRLDDSSGIDPVAARLYGMAAAAVGEHKISQGYSTRSIAGLREQGRLGLLAQVLVVRTWNRIHLGRFDAALADAEEAGRLARETAQPFWESQARAAEATVAAVHGDEEKAEALARIAESEALPLRASAVLAEVQLARGLAALGGGRFKEANEHLRRLLDRRDPVYHYVKSTWSIADLAEAAVHSGHRDDIAGLMNELEELSARIPSPQLQVAMRCARPLVAADQVKEALFLDGLHSDLADWPFARARLQLAYGSWLRRQRRISESRGLLLAARDAFDDLGVLPWAERTREELRASGVTSRKPAPAARDQLTTSELQIAQMAAAGLTNQEIGQSLYLSPRTVSSHLYRIFPKLGITSRSQLHAALASRKMPLS